MDYDAQGWISVIIGTMAFAGGGWIATYGWEVWLYESKGGKWFRSRGAWGVIRGSAVVALAGLLSTHGWNDISLAGQRRNLINGVVLEVAMNAQMLKQPPMEGDVYYPSEDQRLILRPFPTLRTTALNGVLSSGLWDFRNPTERKFLDKVSEYERKIGTANTIFSSHNDYLLAKADPNKAADFGKRLQRGIPEKEFFKALTNAQSQLITLIQSECRWAIRWQEPIAREHPDSKRAQ